MNKEVKQGKIDLSAIHSVMQKELDWKTKSQLLDRMFSESDDRELTMIKHQQWEEIESFISQAVDGNHPKVKGPALYRRFRRKQGKVNRMIILVLSRFLELIKSIDKRLHKIEIIPLNNYQSVLIGITIQHIMYAIGPRPKKKVIRNINLITTGSISK